MKSLPACLFILCSALVARAADVMVCPPWEITVVDEAGKPLAGCTIVQEWGSDFKDVYVTGSTNAVTDASGRVSFPARLVTPPPASRWKKIQRTIDRKRGGEPASTAFVSKAGFQFEWLNAKSDPRNTATRAGLRSRVVLKPEKH